MIIKRLAAVVALLPGLFLGSAMAADGGSDATIRAAILKVLPNAKIDEVTPSPVNGISEVVLDSSTLFYATNDGKYVFEGASLIDLNTRMDLSTERMKGIHLDLLSKVDEKKMIIFPAAEQHHVITVFTDIDCGYCRKLHKQIKEYNNRGITVHYLSFPRTGPDTPSFYKAEAVWCSKDRKDALTRAKNGEELPPGKCDNPVREELELGAQLGVNGTPAIFLEDGELIPGYVPPDKLAAELDHRTLAAGKETKTQ